MGVNRLLEAGFPLEQRLLHHRAALRIEQVKGDEVGRVGAAAAALLRLDAFLQKREAGAAVLVQADNFAIDNHRVVFDQPGQIGQFRKLAGDIAAVAADQTQLAGLNKGQGAHAVPFEFKDVVIGIERLTAEAPEHGLDVSGELAHGFGILVLGGWLGNRLRGLRPLQLGR